MLMLRLLMSADYNAANTPFTLQALRLSMLSMRYSWVIAHPVGRTFFSLAVV